MSMDNQLGVLSWGKCRNYMKLPWEGNWTCFHQPKNVIQWCEGRAKNVDVANTHTDIRFLHGFSLHGSSTSLAKHGSSTLLKLWLAVKIWSSWCASVWCRWNDLSKLYVYIYTVYIYIGELSCLAQQNLKHVDIVYYFNILYVANMDWYQCDMSDMYVVYIFFMISWCCWIQFQTWMKETTTGNPVAGW